VKVTGERRDQKTCEGMKKHFIFYDFINFIPAGMKSKLVWQGITVVKIIFLENFETLLASS